MRLAQPILYPSSGAAPMPRPSRRRAGRWRAAVASAVASILLALSCACPGAALGASGREPQAHGLGAPDQMSEASITCTASQVLPTPPVRLPRGSQFRLDAAAEVDWPYSPWPWPVLSQRVHAIFVADDDGQRRVHATAAQVALWVEQADQIYQGSGIHLDFDPERDWEFLNSTLLNTMTGADHPSWSQQKALGNLLAARTPDEMVVYFRWGPGTAPAGNAFSWTDYNFIVMPGFTDTYVCGDQNIGILAHEAGHYLGLPHTFPAVFTSVDEAQSYFVAHGNDPEAFNADGRDETEPDPFVATYAVQCDTTTTSLTLNAVQFPLPRSNPMSYYYPITRFANSQSWALRQGLLLRSNQGLVNIVRDSAVVAIEGENLQPSVTQGSWINQSMGSFLGFWSGNHQLLWTEHGLGARLTATFRVPEAGSYDVYGSFTAAPDFGRNTHYINGQPAAAIDLYADIVLVTGPVYLGRFELLSGDNEWRVEGAGSNPRAIPRNGYGLDYILIARPETTGGGGPPGPDVALLAPGKPNPFSESTIIGYRVPSRGSLRLRILDLAGRTVTTLFSGERIAGDYSAPWSGTDDRGRAVPSGIYLCRLEVGASAQTQRIALLR